MIVCCQLQWSDEILFCSQALENARQLKLQLERISNADTTKEAMDLAQNIETVRFWGRFVTEWFNIYFNRNLSIAMTRKSICNTPRSVVVWWTPMVVFCTYNMFWFFCFSHYPMVVCFRKSIANSFRKNLKELFSFNKSIAQRTRENWRHWRRFQCSSIYFSTKINI